MLDWLHNNYQMNIVRKQTVFAAIILTLLGSLGLGVVNMTPAVAKIPSSEVGNVPKKVANNAALERILNGVYQLAGVVCVLVIVIAGLRFIIGGDNSDAVASARKAIIYACVGLVIIASAFVITQFIIGRVAM